MAKFGIGQAVRRVEDARFLTGSGRYVDDIVLPGMCHGVVLLSPHAHARIKKVDTAKAKAAPGVLLVLTGADVAADKLGAYTSAMMPEDLGAPKGHRIFQQVLQAEKARFVGDRIAFVVAETQAQARDAAEMIEVDYETLPAVALLEDAAKDGAPKVWDDNPNGNVAFMLAFGDQAATDAAFAKAKHVVKLRTENNRVTPVSMEPRTAIGDYAAADDSYTLYTSSQNPHGVRFEMSQLLHIAENQIRVVAPDVGGGFGLKGGSFPDDVLVLWASKKLRRPVKWVATRSESMMNDHTGRDLVSYGEMALDEKGKILAIRSQSLFQIGAYFVGPGMVSGLFSLRFIPEAYDVQTMHIVCKGLFTNTPQAGPYRGAGRPEAAYFTERMIEHAARQISMDVAEIRRVNLIPPNKFPYNTPTLYTYDSGEFVRLLDKCVEMVDWNGYEKRRKASEKNGKLRGRSVCYYIEFGGIFNDRMDIRFDPGGSVTVFAGTHSHGQGHATVFAQLVHEFLGVPFESIRYVQGDTAQVQFGRGTYGARSAVVGGSALKRAADAIIDKAKPMAAAMLEADAGDIEFSDGTFKVAGTDKAIPLTEVAKASFAPMGPMTKFGIGLEGSGSHSPEPPSHPNGAHAVEVEIDPETGEVTVDRYVMVDDLGQVLNPMIVNGQQHGGVAQGIGQALYEHAVYDRQSAQLVTGSFMDYVMPRADMLPNFQIALEEVPCLTNPIGVKGIGESGTIGAPPVVINAVIDALSPLGIDRIDMPATPSRVWAAIQAAKAA
ncbi:MAG: aerobic carbon-monoxide dehydrogenase large subunit [Hyphomicrobiales bacterium]|nr:aerobic carbon-monoxide dehydrogenase large subunit [Hyphomicrobiales bacterium]